jgi:hypothetical protein
MYVILSNIECICLTDAIGYVFDFFKILKQLSMQGIVQLKRKNKNKIFTVKLCDNSLCAYPLAWSPGQVKLDSDKWKLWKNYLNK